MAYVKKQEGMQIVEKVISIKRNAKVTKGGKRMSFGALVVVGDGNGSVGIALGKANEVANSIKKGLIQARRNIQKIRVVDGTIPHDIIGKFGAAKVLLRSASEGTGIIAAGSVRAVCEAVGIRNILAKALGSTNPVNMVKATLDGLNRLKTGKSKTEEPINNKSKEE